jgi:glucosamine-6-phosphate deaminase
MAAAVSVFPSAERLGDALAGEIAGRLAESGRLVLGCPAGRTPTLTLRALVRELPPDADLSHLTIVMMDEYLQHNGSWFVPVDQQLDHSCRGYLQRELVEPLTRGRPADRWLRPENVLLPDPANPRDFDDRVAALGIDLFILASGASDGHVGFHGPGAGPDSGTGIVALAESTRRDNLGTFPHLRRMDDVPRYGISIGLGTIVRHSASAVLVMTGEHKAPSARRVTGTQEFDPEWPATVIHLCRQPRIWLDHAAAAGDSDRHSTERL